GAVGDVDRVTAALPGLEVEAAGRVGRRIEGHRPSLHFHRYGDQRARRVPVRHVGGSGDGLQEPDRPQERRDERVTHDTSRAGPRSAVPEPDTWEAGALFRHGSSVTGPGETAATPCVSPGGWTPRRRHRAEDPRRRGPDSSRSCSPSWSSWPSGGTLPCTTR